MTHSNSAASVSLRSGADRPERTFLPMRSGHPYTTPAIWRQYDICRQFPAVADHWQDWTRPRAGTVISPAD